MFQVDGKLTNASRLSMSVVTIVRNSCECICVHVCVHVYVCVCVCV